MNKAHISELAIYWYFLSLQLDSGAESDEFLDELIEIGSRLKAFFVLWTVYCFESFPSLDK